MSDDRIALDVKTIVDAIKIAAGVITTVVLAAGGALWRFILKQNTGATERIDASYRAEINNHKLAITELRVALAEANGVIKKCVEREAEDGTANALKEQLAAMRSDLNAANKERFGDLRTNSQVTEGVLNAVLEGVRSVNQNLTATQGMMRSVLDEIRELQTGLNAVEVTGSKIDLAAERIVLLVDNLKKGPR